MSGDERVLMRIHLSNLSRWHSQPLYEALVLAARRAGLSGATVLEGRLGFVAGGPMLGMRPRALPAERPFVIEIVEREELLREFLASWEDALRGGPAFVTFERAQLVPDAGRGAPA